jgi:MFS family permease
MGILRALYSASAVLLGLFAGVWLDRLKRRPVLVGADLGFAVLYVSIPAAAMFGVLRIEQLYLLQLLSGILWVFSDVAHRSFLPSLLQQGQLVEANSKLGFTRSIATLAGPGLAGLLVQLVTSPIAMAVDALSFMMSAILISLIRKPEPLIASASERKHILIEAYGGLGMVFNNPVLRPIAETLAPYHLFTSMVSTLFILYATSELGLESVQLGIIFSGYGPGFLLGSLMTVPIATRFGLGYSVIGAILLNTLAVTLIPLVSGTPSIIVSLLTAAHLLIAFSVQVIDINLLSLRQIITPNNFQGRVNGSFRVINLGATLIGGLLAGILGEFLGLKTTLIVAGGGLSLPFLRLLLSPVRRLRGPLD